MTIVGMATIPERAVHAQCVVEDLLAQDVDHVYVWADDERMERYFVRYPEDVTFLSGARKIGDAGKFAGWDRSWRVDAEPAYFLAVDDDLFYPPDYVEQIVAGVDRYKRRAAVSYHGKILKRGRIKSYYRGGTAEGFRCLGSVERDRGVHNVGTGVLAFHTDGLPAVDLYEDFPDPNMADVWFSILAQKRRLPLVVLAHKAGWIKHQPIDLNKTIYANSRGRDAVQTRAVNEHQPFQIFA